jgi:hypothetical protein
MLSVLDAINAAWNEYISFPGYSPYIAKDWQEFRFEVTSMSFLTRLITTMFGESDGMLIQGTWNGFDEGAAYACGFKVDTITRVPEETDSWTLEMTKSLGIEEPELIVATSSTEWKVNRSGKPEDGGQQFYGGKLHLDIKSGMGVIYDPEHN